MTRNSHYATGARLKDDKAERLVEAAKAAKATGTTLTPTMIQLRFRMQTDRARRILREHDLDHVIQNAW